MNENEDHIPLLETCQKMKELGWGEETEFYWRVLGGFRRDKADKFKFITKENTLITKKERQVEMIAVNKFFYPAPLVSEIGKELPNGFRVARYKDHCSCTSTDRKFPVSSTYSQTEAEARAKMWIYLKENKLM